MTRTTWDPISECWNLFRRFSSFGCCGGRRYYTRKERIEELEKLKTELQREITGIDETIQDLKDREAKVAGA